jgi:hypothetical protein
MTGNAISSANAVSLGGILGNIAGSFSRAFTQAPAAANDLGAMLAQVAATGSPVERGQALRALDAMMGGRAAANAVARGEASTSAAGKAEVCTVEVRYKPVALGADHAFIVTTDSDSVRYFRGGPQSNNTGLNSPNSGSSSDGGDANKPAFDPKFGIYGPIVTEYGNYEPKTVDWTTKPSGAQVVDRILGNCDRIEGQFSKHMDDIEAARTNYMPLNQNSNSTVRETLERAGYPNVKPVVWAPAWNAQLP